MRTTVTILVAVLLVGAAVAPGAVAAQSDDDASVASQVLDRASGVLGFVKGLVADVTQRPADRDAATSADELQAYYNNHSDAFETWLNDRTDASEDLDVVNVTLVRDGEATTRYLVGTVNGSNYTDTQVVEETNRSVDETCVLSGEAAANAPDELETFHTEFVQADATPTKSYMGRMKGQYRSEVSCSFMG